MNTDRLALSAPLANRHVRLEPLAEAHREPLRAAAADPDLWRFQFYNQHGSNFDAWFDYHLAEAGTDREACWAVFDIASNAYAGATSYLAINLAHRKLEIGNTWYAKPFWAGAVNPSCKRLLLARGFGELGLNRIELKLDATNIRSFRAIARLGARFEGIHRAHMVLPDGRVRDTAWFSILKEEWPTVSSALDARLSAFT